MMPTKDTVRAPAPRPAATRYNLAPPPATTRYSVAPPPPVTTRYGAAPPPRLPIREPRLVHTLMLMAWLGRLIDPLPHHADG